MSNDDLIHQLHQAILAGNPSLIVGENPDEIEISGAYPIDTPVTRMDATFATQFLTKEQAEQLERIKNG